MWEAIALGAALAMDAVAVTIVRGAQNRARGGGARDALMLPLLFALFQAGMAALGWIVGETGGPYVEAYDHWIAFALLLLLGGKMVHGAWFAGPPAADEEVRVRSGLWVDLGLALATSIDAAAAGITLSLVPVSPVVAIAAIGIVTGIACGIAYAVGRAVGERIHVRLEGIGGLLLMAIGVRVLVQHL